MTENYSAYQAIEMEKTGIPSVDGSYKKLTSWANEPSLQSLKLDLEASQPSQQKQIGRIQGWNDLMAVRGKNRPPEIKGRSSVQPKLVRRQAEWRYSALTEPFLSSNKLFKVTPVTFEDKAAATQNQLVLNHQFRTKMNRVRFVDDFVRATVDEGTSIVRLGWKRETTKIKETVPVYTYFALESEEQLQPLQQALELKQENPREYDEKVDPAIKAAVDFYEETGDACYAVQTGTEEVSVDKILENRPTVEVMNPENVYIDPSCNGDLDKALFVVISFETNQAELKKEGNRYKNLDQINWEDNAPLAQPNHATGTPDNFQFKDPTRKKVVAYEYWGFYDIHKNDTLVPIVCTWIGSTLIRMEENPFPDQKLPFVLVPYMPVKRELYGEPDAELLEDSQRILGAVTRGMIDLLGRSANGQRGFAKGMLDPLNRRRYDDGKDYEYNPSVNPQSGLIEHKYPELPQSALVMANMQNQEAEALTGVKSFGGGISGEAFGDVAAGIRGVLDAASKREMAILRRLAKGMSEIGTKIISMNGAFLSEKEVVRITNDEFIEVLREDLLGNFDLEVDISTAEVDNAKSQDLGFMLQTIGPNIDPTLNTTILAEICDLKRMPDLAERLRKWQPQPDPLVEQLKQIEVQKAQKELEKLDSEIALNHAKAQQVTSDKDLKDLNYVEQETGTKHARELEKSKAQSQGNQNLEVTKALTKARKEGESSPDLAAAIGFNRVSDKLNEENQPASIIERDQVANSDPRMSINSSYFDPALDPALNPGMNI